MNGNPIFKPTPRAARPAPRNIKIELEPDKYAEVSRRAQRAGISLKQYVRQALDFAMSHEVSNG